MFSNVLIKPIQIAEKIFHLICDPSTNAEELEKVGVEIIKVANDIKKQQAAPVDPPAESAKEEEKKEVVDGDKQ
jgi:hypothetical protein